MMLASTLIQLLGEAVAEHGDLPVRGRECFANRAVVAVCRAPVRVRKYVYDKQPILLLDHEEKDRVH